MKTTSAIILALAVLSTLPSDAQSTMPQSKPPSVKTQELPTFQIDGLGICRPGRYQIQKGRSIPLYSALHLAGGFIHFAKQDRVCIERSKHDKMVTFKIDATDSDVLFRFQVQANDKVTVSAYRPIGDLPPFQLFPKHIYE